MKAEEVKQIIEDHICAYCAVAGIDEAADAIAATSQAELAAKDQQIRELVEALGNAMSFINIEAEKKASELFAKYQEKQNGK